MCKAITDLIQDGKAEGKIEAYVNFINKGKATVSEAASMLGITEEKFYEQAEAYGFKIASGC